MKRVLLSLVALAFSAQVFAANPQVTLEISGGVTGTIVLELYADKAPVTVANFIDYVQSGFYNDLIFHRVIVDFMVQGGGFDADLVQKTTNPPIINESIDAPSNLRGTIAMARTNQTHSATSQFFINHVDNSFLDFGAIVGGAYRNPGYCVFGKVISGMDVVDAIAVVTTATEGGWGDVPVNDIFIQTATVTVNAPICIDRLAADIDGDCNVGLADFAILSSQWLERTSLYDVLNYDFDNNGIVDQADLIDFAAGWLTTYDMGDFAVFASEWLDTETWYVAP